ncbi:MAG: hypothetical protein D3925_09590 [Candidatus Electrothrix sp. AR5]|nr:hypothetical protein [Candidatus Electrothrix sp. AR5]
MQACSVTVTVTVSYLVDDFLDAFVLMAGFFFKSLSNSFTKFPPALDSRYAVALSFQAIILSCVPKYSRYYSAITYS